MSYQDYYRTLRPLIKKVHESNKQKLYTSESREQDSDKFFTPQIGSSKEQEKTSIPIPVKGSEDKKKTEIFKEHFLDYYTDFFEEMKIYADQTYPETPFSYFNSYWPTYSQMDKKQRNYYFYWRSEVLKGQFIETDEGYLKILFYEILSGLHYKNLEDGYRLLYSLFQNYSKLFPSLRSMLYSWILDFILVNQIDLSDKQDFLRENHRDKRAQNILLKNALKNLNSKRSLEIISLLTDYDIKQSKLYLEAKEPSEKVFSRLLSFINYYLLNVEKMDLMDKFMKSAPQKMSFPIYLNALTPISGQTVTTEYLDYRRNQEFKEYLLQIVKHSENILREHLGVRGRLRTTLNDERLVRNLKIFIQNLLEEEKEESYTETIFNESLIQNLRTESDKVQSVLEVEDAFIFEETNENEESSKEQDIIKDSSESLDYFSLEELPEEFQELVKTLKDYHSELIVTILENGEISSVLNRLSKDNNILPDLILEEINEQALETIEDILIDDNYEIDEEYTEILEKSRKWRRK